jgi:O-antigen/teichoic acid export membrane protein
MNTKKIIARNAVCNWAGMGTTMLVGFLIAPFLVHQLGSLTYGLWIVIGSLTSYFLVLDLGIGGSVGRNVAFFRARNDLAGINGILSTAFFYLCGAAALALLATVGALFLFFHFIAVEPDQHNAAQLALLLVGLNFALALPLQSFDGILWAYQRFDLQNAVDIPIVLIRAGLTWWFIGSGYGLVALASITLATSLTGQFAKAALALWLEPGLRVRLALIDRESAKGLFGYGIWYFLFSLFKTIGPQVIVMIVANGLGAAIVTPLSVATRLISYANQFLIAGTGILTPVATALHASQDRERQKELFIMGGRACMAMTLLFASLFVFLGEPLIRLWMGPTFAVVYSLLLIVMAGELLPMSQHITFGMILGKGRLRILAANSLVEIFAGSLLSFLAAKGGYGLTGVCLAVAIPAAICRGVSPLIYACRAVGVPLWVYVARGLAPAVAIASGPVLVLGLVTRMWTPTTWPGLFVCGGVYSVAYVGVIAVGLFGGRGGLARLTVKAGPKEVTEPELAATAKL